MKFGIVIARRTTVGPRGDVLLGAELGDGELSTVRRILTLPSRGSPVTLAHSHPRTYRYRLNGSTMDGAEGTLIVRTKV